MASTLTNMLPAMTDPRPKTRVVGSAFSFADHAWTFSFQAADLHQEIVTLDTTTVSGVVEWLSNDPIGISGGLNQYVFCANNPVNFVDPFGLEESFLMGASQTMAGYLDGLAFGVLPNQDNPNYRAGQTAGDVVSLAGGLARLGYAGAAKGSSLLLRRAPTLSNAMRAVANRNTLKKVFRLNPWSEYRIYPYEAMDAKYLGDLLEIIKASGRTNPYLNLLGAGMAGHGLYDLFGEDDATPYDDQCK